MITRGKGEEGRRRSCWRDRRVGAKEICLRTGKDTRVHVVLGHYSAAAPHDLDACGPALGRAVRMIAEGQAERDGCASSPNTVPVPIEEAVKR